LRVLRAFIESNEEEEEEGASTVQGATQGGKYEHHKSRLFIKSHS
jgi:hypothetical protein